MTTQQKLDRKKKKAIRRTKVGKNIKQWRLGEGLRLVPLGAKVGVSQGSLSDIENGKTSPSYDTIWMFKKMFPGTDWDRILFA